MIAEKINSDNLNEYYTKLTQLQQKHHGEEYSLVHNEIKSLLTECDSYVEFGVKQGTTLAVALFTNTKRVTGYDITVKWYQPVQHLFKEYAEANNITLNVIPQSSLLCVISDIDLLYIDDLHKYTQVKRELEIHNKNVNKFIVFHDTTLFPEIKKAVMEFVDASDDWVIYNESTVNVGFMTIKRTQQ